MGNKYILFFSALTLILSGLSGQVYSQFDLTKKTEAREASNISRAKIKSMTQYESNSKEDSKNSRGKKVLFNEFDSTGRCYHWVRVLPNGSTIEERNTFRFDSKGRLKERLAWGSNGNLDNRLVSIYDNTGLEVETDKILPDSSKALRWLHSYDSKGREIESVTFEEKDTTRLVQSYTYNDADNTIETLFKRGEKVTYRVVKEYDRNGNMILEKQFKPDGTLTRREENKYDSSGNLLKNDVFNSEGKLILMSDFIYDSFGNPMSENRFDARKNTTVRTTYEYEFY